MDIVQKISSGFSCLVGVEPCPAVDAGTIHPYRDIHFSDTGQAANKFPVLAHKITRLGSMYVPVLAGPFVQLPGCFLLRRLQGINPFKAFSPGIEAIASKHPVYSGFANFNSAVFWFSQFGADPFGSISWVFLDKSQVDLFPSLFHFVNPYPT